MREMVHPGRHARSNDDDAISSVDCELLRSGLHFESNTFGVHWSEDSTRQFAFRSRRLFLFRIALLFLGRGYRNRRAEIDRRLGLELCQYSNGAAKDEFFESLFFHRLVLRCLK